jgi:outer membrane protein assembly factor BamA
LDVDNESPLSREEILSYVPLEPGEPPSPPDVREGILELLAMLADRGYVRAEVEYAIIPDGAGHADCAVTVRAGERYPAGEIKFIGATAAEERALRDRLETVTGKPLRERPLARDLLTVIDYYRERGYPEATARPGNFEIAEEYRELDFGIRIDAGPRVIVRTVEIVGNRRTRDGVIRRELRVLPGEPYDIDEIRSSARRVYNLKYFAAEPDVELVDAAAGALRVTVTERPTYRVTGALVYEPDPGDEEAALIGEMDAALANLFGTGREAGAYYRRLTRENMDARGRYYEPWIGGIDLFAEPAGTFRERTTYRQTDGELSLGTHPVPDLTVAGGGGFTRVRGENASRKYKVFTWAAYDSRDYFDNPRRGWRIDGRLELGVKEYEADGFRERVPRLLCDVWYFRPLARNHVVGGRVYGRGLSTKRPSADELFPLGGYADLRGFSEEHFLTDRHALVTAEYRFLIGRGSRLFVFADGAYRHLKMTTTFSEGFEFAYGAGFRTATPVGTYGVDYSLAAGESPLDGKIHVSITQEF